MTYEVLGSMTLPNPGNSLLNTNTPDSINNAGIVGGEFLTQPPGYPPIEEGYTLSPAGDFSFPSYPGWDIASVGTSNNGISFGDAEAIDGLGNATSPPFGFTDDNGSFIPVPSGQYGSELNGMNAVGLAVGNNAVDAQGDTQPFIYNTATETETPLFFQGVTDPVVNDINDAGQMVGYGTVPSSGITEGLYLNGQGGVQFLAPPGATASQALGLNNTGQVVGDYTDTAGQEHGFLFDIATQAYTTLDFPNATSTYAASINDNGQVVGGYTDSQGLHGMVLTVANV
jgi:probable HAF family extracellular repeat protein